MNRGHKVTLFGVPEVAEKIERSNLGFCEIGASDFPSGSIATMYAELGRLNGLAGLKFAIKFFEQEAKMLFRDAPEAIRKAGINLLLVDQLTNAGGTIADYLNLPFITVCNALPINRELGVPPSFTDWQAENSWRARLRNQFGYSLLDYFTRLIWNVMVQQRQQWQLPLHRSREDGYSQLAQIAQLPQELDFPRERLVPWFHYVGLLKNPADLEPVSLDRQDFPWEKLNGKPLIYANLGTLQSHNWDVFHCIATACQDIDAQLVISLGNPNADPAQTNFPGNPLVVAFPPHQQLIVRAELVITHAGSTAVSCLSSGVPMVAIPITTDQPGMAARVARVGAGEVVSLAKLTAPKLRQAIDRVLTQRSYRDHAQKLSTAIKQAGGVKYAADIVERVLQNDSPALK